MSRKIFAKAATVVVALSMVFAVFAVPTAPAQAQTDAELAAQIQALLATIAALQAQISGGVTSASCPVGGFTFDLAIGAQGQAVVDLQRFLNAQPGIQVATAGPGAPGQESMYFGPLTRAAVIQFQQAHASVILAPLGLAAGTGYWGPSSRAHANALCAAAPTPDDDDDDDDDDADDDDDEDDSDGEEGSFTVTRGSASSATVDLGATEEVYSIEIEAEGSDIEVNRIDFLFDVRPWLYLAEVALEVDGEVVEEMDVDEDDITDDIDSGDITDGYRLRWTGLDLDVEEGEEIEVVLLVTPFDSLPGDREDDTMTVQVPDDGVRGTDGAGLIHYEPSGDLDTRAFTFDENFGEGSIDASSNNDSPESGIIVVSSTTDTQGVEVLLFDVEADNGDVTVDDVYIVATSSDDVDDVVGEVTLMNGSTELDSATFVEATSVVTTVGGGTIAIGDWYAHFEDLNFDIDEDEEVTLSLEAEFREADGTAAGYSTGTTVTFEVEEVSGENSDFEDTAEINQGIGSGSEFTLLTSGIFVEAEEDDQDVSSMTDPGAEGGSDQYRTYTLRFDVTSIEEDAYIFNSVGTTSTSGIQFDILQGGQIISNAGGGWAGTTTTSLSSSADLVDTGSNSAWLIEEGETETFTVQILLDPASAGFYGVELDVVEFNDDASDTESTYTELVIPNESEFETDEANIDN